MRKKKVLIHTDYSLAKTGFGKNAKNLLTYLYKTGKYDLVHYCCGMSHQHVEFSRLPWKTIGCLPHPAELNNYLNSIPTEGGQREVHARAANYGNYLIDRIVKEERPDIYLGIQDIWGVDYAISKYWFGNIHSCIWTTLDSLPLLPTSVELAPKIKHYWVWSKFAETEMHRLGHKHVRTMHGLLDTSHFYKLLGHQKHTLRKIFNIDPNTFVIGFVFRNQLRKSVPNLLEGYKIFKQNNPTIKTALLLHTSFAEGWNITKMAKEEYGLDLNEILTTYICRKCKRYEIKPFAGQDQGCRFCRTNNSQITTGVGFGVTEDQLNEIYNLMDVYCHPFTSGGQEIPVQEAKLAELITLVTNYSCGEEICEDGSGSLALDWSEYREHGTEFRKASTLPSSIAKQLQKVHSMDAQQRIKLGKVSREWVIKNFSVENVGKQIEEYFDSLPLIEDYNFEEPPVEPKDPQAAINPQQDNKSWLKSLYKEILKMEVNDEDSGLQYWINQLANNAPRDQIENYFRHEAFKENQKNKRIEFEELLNKDDKGRRILYIIPESFGDVFISTALFRSIKAQYPDHTLYIATKPEFMDVLKGNPYVDKVIPYAPQMDNQIWLEGTAGHRGFFEASFHPYFSTQRMLNYLNNGKTNIAVNLQYE